MGFFCLSSQIEVLSLPLISGSHFRKVLVLKLTLVQHFIRRRIDGHAKHTIKALEDILRDFVINFKGSWDDHLPLIEFAYINSYHSTVQMYPYEALYGRIC